MKKLLLILLCLPMIGFGQDSELSKYNNDTQFNFSLETGLTIQTDINAFFDNEFGLSEINPMFNVFYLKGNSNYDISFNKIFDFYNKLSLLFKYRNGGQEYEITTNSLLQPYSVSGVTDMSYYKFRSFFNTQLFYSGGIEMMISEKIKQRFGGTLTLLNIFSSDGPNTDFFLKPPSVFSVIGWGGINYELDYLISNEISVNFALGRIMIERPFNNGLYNFTFNDWITEISFGTTYTF
jgi:hypothetical protein